MEDIKQRLFQVLQRHSGEPFPVAVVEVLARDALAEIERLEGELETSQRREARKGTVLPRNDGPAAVPGARC